MKRLALLAVLSPLAVGCGDAPHYFDIDGGADGAAVDAAAIDAMEPGPDAEPPDAAQPANMVFVAAGAFLRGCNALVEDCTGALRTDESPSAQITLSAYWIDETEVTQDAYQACMTAGACTAPAGDFAPSTLGVYPVVRVTWVQAVSYCTWRGKRLPTEAEWEKAARGTDGRTYPWGDNAPTCSLAYYADCPGGTTSSAPVGSRPLGASPVGALDMAGNASEWVADWYNGSYYASAPSTDPTGPVSGTNRGLRGGSWNAETTSLLTANRYAIPPTYASDNRVGFRCAQDD